MQVVVLQVRAHLRAGRHWMLVQPFAVPATSQWPERAEVRKGIWVRLRLGIDV